MRFQLSAFRFQEKARNLFCISLKAESCALKAEDGQVLIGVVILFTAILTTVIVGIVSPILSHVQMAKNLQHSKQSFFAAESLGEDLAYRLKTGMEVSANESLTLGEATASANITTTGGNQEITATSDMHDFIRSIRIILTQGAGIAFNYGTQTGNGGFIINNNAGVNGNVYSNGSITGANGAFVTGTAVAANSIAQTADQINDTPDPSTDSITFSNANGTQDLAQSFRISADAPANSVSFYMRKSGSGTPPTATVRITADNGGVPAGTSLTTATLNGSLVTASYGWVTVVFPTGVNLLAGTTYWIVIDSSNSSTYYQIAANSAYANGQAKIGRYGSSWSNTSPAGLDAYFRFYVGGQTSTISNLSVGQNGVGDTWAHAVTDSTIEGNNFCQAGSGNNKPCDDSEGDPDPQPYPVSDGNIASWKAAAAAGTVISGNHTVSATSTLGPTEITGNLTVNAELTLTGVVYVHGSITISNGKKVKLDPLFGSTGTILLSDGRIKLENNIQFSGSGESGSYILLLTTSNCPTDVSCSGAYAIDVANNAGAVIMNAQKGTVYVKNNAGAKEITANKLILEPNAVVTYESGLASTVFTTGPSGGYTIAEWNEAQ